jgi:CHASE2 domain-containing sensor protein
VLSVGLDILRKMPTNHEYLVETLKNNKVELQKKVDKVSDEV